MSAVQRTMITVQPNDYLSGQTEELEEAKDSPQIFAENDTRSDFQTTLCTEDMVASALQHGHLTADQALWLHQHQVNWQISVE
jgi:hypothetical protein